MMQQNRFNIRVYGLLINEQRVLVTDEYRMGIMFTKFPGGGLEFGEGTIDCLKREFMEEMNQPIEVVEHFYTTDFFQVSAFNSEHQIISIYYLVKCSGEINFITTEEKFKFENKIEGAQTFRWLELSKLSEDDFHFPIDKMMVQKLKDKFIAK
jgi:8-oxo-dGTP diphosphatase